MISGTLSRWHSHAGDELDHPGSTRVIWACLLAPFAGMIVWVSGQHPLVAGAGAIGAAVVIDRLARWLAIPAFIRRIMLAVPAEGSQLVTYTWDSQYLSWKTAHANTRRRWTDFLWFDENDDVMLLSLAEDFYLILPKPWFRNERQQAQFRTLALTSVTGDPRVQRGGLPAAFPYVIVASIVLLFVYYIVTLVAP